MSSFWPRSKGVVIDGMGSYKAALREVLARQSHIQTAPHLDVSKLASEAMIELTAEKCVEALDEVQAMPSRLPKELSQGVYQWLALMPGFAEKNDESDLSQMKEALQAKANKGLI